MLILSKLLFLTGLLSGTGLAGFISAEEFYAQAPLNPGCPKRTHRQHCLTAGESIALVNRWAEIFDLTHSGDELYTLLNCTVAYNIYAYNKAFTFGDNGKGELYSSRKELYKQQEAAYRDRNHDAIQTGAFRTVFLFHDCDNIAWRWQFNGTTSGKADPPASTNTVKGKEVLYYGTDIIFMQEGSIRIKHVVTSSDIFNEYFAIGRSFQNTSICPS